MTVRASGLLNLKMLFLLNLEVICLTNLEIICNEAIINGVYTRDEIEDLLAQGLEPALHTYTGWKARGKVVKHGEKGIEVIANDLSQTFCLLIIISLYWQYRFKLAFQILK